MIVRTAAAHAANTGEDRPTSNPTGLTRKRASYGKDVLDLLFYHDLAHGLVHNVHQFFQAANQTPPAVDQRFCSPDPHASRACLSPVRRKAHAGF